MTTKNPTNGELAIMLENIGKSVIGIEAHLATLNGQVAKNTKHSTIQKTNNKWVYGFVTLLGLPIALLLIKAFV